MKEEVKRLRQQHRDKMSQLCSQDHILPEVEHLVETVEVHEMEDEIVTITGMNPVKAAAEAGLCLGDNEED